MTEKYPYSVHAFMLPLKWDYLPADYLPGKGKQHLDYDSRTDLQKINKKLQKTLFKRKFYRLNEEVLNYNELSYFHAYVARSIFDLQQQDEPTLMDVAHSKTLLYYEVEVNEFSSFSIQTTAQTFKLQLGGISLHVFNTGIAIVTYNLLNYSYQLSEDILKINEFGRRFYPPFLAGIDGAYSNIPKGKMLATKITLELPDRSIEEDFSQYDTLRQKETHHFVNHRYEFGQIIAIPNHVVKLFDKEFVFGALYEKGDAIRFNTIGDDRMFFQSWYGNNTISNVLKGTDDRLDSSNDFWFAFTNGDPSETDLGLKSKHLQQKLVKQRTYRLWEGYGTFFGFTRDSFVCLSEELATNNIPDLRQHMKTLYYHMSVLTLAQRASVLRFSAEISSLADLGKTEPRVASKLIEKLYLNYIEFINKIYFREVTPQMQGIDIYAKMQEAMNIRDDIRNLDEELAELHNFSMMIKQDLQNNQAFRLTRMATWFLPASLTFGILGANFYGEHFNWGFGRMEGNLIVFFWLAMGLLPSFILYLLIKFKIIKL